MTLWWIGNIIFALVVIRALLFVLHTLITPARHIRLYADDITDSVETFPPHLDALQELGRTRELVRQVSVDLQRYVRALDDIP